MLFVWLIKKITDNENMERLVLLVTHLSYMFSIERKRRSFMPYLLYFLTLLQNDKDLE